MHELCRKVLVAVQRHGLTESGETLVVAVSGGADSLALLHILRRIATELNIRLHVATFDHGLRKESAEDARFVEQLAAEWALPVTVGQADVITLARERGIGIELAARQARYAFLADVARTAGAQRTGTAHHLNDQAETVLMHILRGAGMKGLQGMSYLSSLPFAPDLMLIRPLLSIPRDALAAYCHEHELVARADESNLNTEYLRNHIRHNILPALKTINPQVEYALARLANVTTVDQDFLNSKLAHDVIPLLRHEGGRVFIDRDLFATLHPAMQRRCIFYAASRINSGQEVGFEHCLHAVEVGLRGRLGSLAELPGGLRLRVDYKELVMESADQPDATNDTYLLLPRGAEITLNLPGLTSIPGERWSLRAETSKSAAGCVARLAIPTGSGVKLRTRRPGDRILPWGMQGHSQKVSRWMVNKKIPQRLRDRIPLLVVDDRIAAIVFADTWVVAHEFAVHTRPLRIIYFFTNYS
jgi:tRNA(Ile)-lysidine synthetase-like protein